ncbi:hypothetical protein [Aeromonas dhakensis]|uniref:hypothetical protein n=1 Tax=Aeromonas dhakensis TaxID=196024 RepID=UPI001F608884|nr:hypothetical protein [Aeromonas dhakensis]UNU87929.1 hypothetical protein GB930_06825 [Aeromonas dhakensis]
MSNKAGIDIGMEYMKGIYNNTNVETKEAQPIYILQRDSVRTFLHEKIELIGLSAKVMGYVGVFITLIATLATAEFTDVLGLKGPVVNGAFVTFTIIIAVVTLREGCAWYKSKSKLDVDSLTEDLGNRGSIIRPTAE